MVVFCTNCGTKLDDDDAFCMNCGTKVYNINKDKNLLNKSSGSNLENRAIKMNVPQKSGEDNIYIKRNLIN